MIKLENVELDFSFVYSPKCACSTLRRIFLNLKGIDHASEGYKKYFQSPEQYFYSGCETSKNYWFVRDPFDRFCSALKNILINRLDLLNRAVSIGGINYRDIGDFSESLPNNMSLIQQDLDNGTFLLAFSDNSWVTFIKSIEDYLEKPILEITLRDFVEFLFGQTSLDKIDVHFVPQVYNRHGINISKDIEIINIVDLDAFLKDLMAGFSIEYIAGNKVEMNKSNYSINQLLTPETRIVDISPDINQSSLNIPLIREFVSSYYKLDYERFNFVLNFNNNSDSPEMSYSQLLLNRCKAVFAGFQPEQYLQKNSDLSKAGITTLDQAMEHFLKFGQFEDREIL